MGNEEKLGFSGRLAARFQESAITPLLALTGLLLGLLASGITPREEEPQIDVTFANIFVPFPGASAVEVENLVSGRMEQILAEVEGVEHTFSVSRPGMAILTVQFEVGQFVTRLSYVCTTPWSPMTTGGPRGSVLCDRLSSPRV